MKLTNQGNGTNTKREMNLKLIKGIVESELPDFAKEDQIIKHLSQDEKVIPKILKMIEIERESKNELLKDMNLELSRAHIYIDTSIPKKEAKGFSRNFILDCISKFYVENKSRIGHCFNRFNT